jgi:hypothetical protein
MAARKKGRQVVVTLSTEEYIKLSMFGRMYGESVAKMAKRSVGMYLGYLDNQLKKAADQRLKELAEQGVTISVGAPQKEAKDGE